VCLVLVSLLASADAAEPPVDPSLLEFLGSVDTDDRNWHEYLAHTDIDQVARRADAVHQGTTPPPHPAPADTSSAAPPPPVTPPVAPAHSPSVTPP
jgi:hypothetical protein